MRELATIRARWRIPRSWTLARASRVILATGVPAVLVPSPGGQPAAAPSPTATAVELSAAPAHPRAGQPIRLVVVHPPGAATDYRWEVGGAGGYPLDTGAVPQTAAVFPSAGRHTVSVRVSTAAGTEVGSLTLVVAPAGASTAPGPTSRSSAAPAPRTVPAHAARPAGTTPALRHTSAAGPPPPARSRTAGTPPGAPPAVAHVAGDPGVTIVDFKFAPGSTTVHTGDTITWTNDGPSPHTATASDHSFDTGTLSRGQSGSHTFTTPGTFAYICTIHPFMHGTIVVLASATTTPTTSTTPTTPAASSQPSTTPPPTTGQPTATPATAGTPTLPVTGMNVGDVLLAGLLLLGAGVTLRRTRSR
jgi:plastocyanin